jgi:hypothetical protein
MTTPTSKHVKRVTIGHFSGRIIGRKPRRIEVKIAGDTLILRLYGTQQREYLQISDAFETARSRRVLAEMAAKRAAKKRSTRP